MTSNIKVLLINAGPRQVQADFLPKNLPLNILSVASTLIGKYEVILLDRAVNSNDDELRNHLKDSFIKCIGISTLSGESILDAIHCSGMIKEARQDIKVVWGGWHATKAPESILKEGIADFVIRGEGEKVFRTFLGEIDNTENQKKIPGVCWCQDDTIHLSTPEPPLDIRSLPKLPIELIEDIEPYIFDNWIPGGNRCLPWETSRGCPLGCSFCDVHYFFGKSYSGHTPERIFEDMERLRKKYNIGGVRFYDPNFFLNLDRVTKLCILLIENKSSIKWSASGSILQFRNIPIETLQLFYSAGLRVVECGIESGDERLRKELLNKKFSNADCEKVLQHFQKVGIQFKFNTMIGLPGEKLEESFETLDFALNIIQSYTNTSVGGHIYLYMPFVGTGLFELAHKMGYKPPSSLSEYANLDYSRADKLPWLDDGHRKKLEAISVMTYLLSAPKTAIPLNGLKKCLFSFLRKIYLFRLRNHILWKTPDISILQKLLQ